MERVAAAAERVRAPQTPDTPMTACKPKPSTSSRWHGKPVARSSAVFSLSSFSVMIARETSLMPHTMTFLRPLRSRCSSKSVLSSRVHRPVSTLSIEALSTTSSVSLIFSLGSASSARFTVLAVTARCSSLMRLRSSSTAT